MLGQSLSLIYPNHLAWSSCWLVILCFLCPVGLTANASILFHCPWKKRVKINRHFPVIKSFLTIPAFFFFFSFSDGRLTMPNNVCSTVEQQEQQHSLIFLFFFFLPVNTQWGGRVAQASTIMLLSVVTMPLLLRCPPFPHPLYLHLFTHHFGK